MIGIYIFLAAMTWYLLIYTYYSLALVMFGIGYKQKSTNGLCSKTRIAVIIPAHNEEKLIVNLLESINCQNYPRRLYRAIVVADNCIDCTGEIAKQKGAVVLERNNLTLCGKGYAIKHAFDNIENMKYAAYLIVDADSIIDRDALKQLDFAIQNGAKAIQCYNGIGNPDESWFTNLMDVSRTISNVLVEPGKERLGLSSHLMGNGMCFTKQIIEKVGWNAFSVGEDWEFYARIIESNELITFVKEAMVFHQESKEIRQATSQRLRWSSGRIQIIYKSGISLFLKGLFELNFKKIDATFPLLFPNPSMAVNMNLLCMLSTIVCRYNRLTILLGICLFTQLVIFLIGICFVKKPWKKLLSIFLAPLFLVWKMTIDILSLFGFGRKNWIRTKRH